MITLPRLADLQQYFHYHYIHYDVENYWGDRVPLCHLSLCPEQLPKEYIILHNHFLLVTVLL